MNTYIDSTNSKILEEIGEQTISAFPSTSSIITASNASALTLIASVTGNMCTVKVVVVISG